MMSDVDKLELATIGASIEVPQTSAYRSAGSRRARRYGLPPNAAPTDRLTELAAWWATVAGTAPPRRVEQLWLSRPSSAGPAQAEVLIRRFDAPRSIPEALAWGITVADDTVDDGTDLVLLSIPGDPSNGTDDDVSWQVLAAHLLAVDPVEALGWPKAAGLSDADWIVRVAAVRDGLRPLRGIAEQPEHLLDLLASPALAAGTGLLLQTAARRTPVLLDGPGAATCALLAYRIARAGQNWWRATDAEAGPLHQRVLSELRLTPLTNLGLRTEDGTAARIGLTLLETAIGRALEGTQTDQDDDSVDDGAGLVDAEPDR
jgi:nicotinate-nucleotide--dimethylbenzimidazole phosphoribosyltransferase